MSNPHSSRFSKERKTVHKVEKSVPLRTQPKPSKGKVFKGDRNQRLKAIVSEMGQGAIERKGAGSMEVASSESSSVARALLDPLAVYTFKISQTGLFSSNAGGFILANTFWSPAGLAEYTSLVNLFDLVRIRFARVSIIPTNPHADAYAAGRINDTIFVACDHGLSGTSPATVQAVIDCPNTMPVSLGSSKVHILDTRTINNEWASTATPAPGPYAGCYGQFSYGASNLTASLSYVRWYMECVYEFTSRT